MFQFPGQGKPPVGVLFDSDFGNRIDTILALALLYGLDGKNECRVVGTTTSKPSLKSAAFYEVMARFWASNPPPAVFALFARPVGMATGNKDAEDTPILSAVFSKQNPDGTPAYAPGIKKLTDTADPAPFIRNVFTAHHDENCMVVIAGPVTNLVRSMQLPGVADLASKKVRYIVIAETPSIGSDPASLDQLLAEWPTPIFFAPASLAQDLSYPGAAIETEFSWATGPHPLVDAYRASRTMPYDAPAGELAAALFAVRSSLFQTSEPGILSTGTDGKVSFAPSASGKHRQVSMIDANRDQIQKAFVELTSAKPVPRAPRRKPPVQQQEQLKKKAEEQKKPPTP